MPLLIVPGLILLLAGSSWFTGAATVGWICLALGVAPLVLVVLVFLLGLLGVAVVGRR